MVKVLEAFQAEQELRRGCILSLHLFNIYGEHIICEALEHWTGGISIGGRRISNLRYSDYTSLIASDEEEMAQLVNLLKMASEKLGFRIMHQKRKSWWWVGPVSSSFYSSERM